ncbi:hypothetical protein [Brachybacterium sp. NPDC056505]|uniref:hypothetical protein n=1 Tax=Brachybacterium sp. NPDC056505 TaxID=3345843 RepID=UPI00366F9211
MFVRFQSAVPNRRGAFPGIFAMANGLRDAGVLSPEDDRWVRRMNAHCERAYTDPSTVVTDCYDHERNPGARSWFRENADELLAIARAYTQLLDRCRIPWEEVRTSTPGRIVYEDSVQVVAVPFTYAQDWPLPVGAQTRSD